MSTLSTDRIGGLIWVAFGGAIVYGSWAMDRLTSLNIPPSTAPGVVPGLLGLGIIIFGMVLVLRRSSSVVAAPSFASSDVEAAKIDEPLDWKRIGLSLALCLAYGGLLLGRGIPYWALTFAFLFLHILLLDETGRVPAPLSLRRTLMAATIALVVATAVALVFRYVFLVRLP
jgi:hypothetical protein